MQILWHGKLETITQVSGKKTNFLQLQNESTLLKTLRMRKQKLKTVIEEKNQQGETENKEELKKFEKLNQQIKRKENRKIYYTMTVKGKRNIPDIVKDIISQVTLFTPKGILFNKNKSEKPRNKQKDTKQRNKNPWKNELTKEKNTDEWKFQ